MPAAEVKWHYRWRLDREQRLQLVEYLLALRPDLEVVIEQSSSPMEAPALVFGPAVQGAKIALEIEAERHLDGDT